MLTVFAVDQGPPIFVPVDASHCTRCGLSGAGRGRYWCAADDGPLCWLCRQTDDPTLPDVAADVLLLPEIAQPVLTALSYRLVLAVMAADRSGCAGEPSVFYHRALLDGLIARVVQTRHVLPAAARLSTVRQALAGERGAAREQLRTRLLGLRLMPVLTYPPTARYFQALLDAGAPASTGVAETTVSM